jgi:hypothetical protein
VTVKNGKIKIDIEVNAEGAARGFDRVSGAADKSRKAVEKNDAALKAAKLEYQVATARAENLAATQAKLTARVNAFTQASDRSAAAMKHASAANERGASGLGQLARGAGKVAGGLGLVIGAGAAAASVASYLADESLKVTAIYDNLPYPLEQARAATHGLVDELTLATAATTLNSTRVATNSKDFAALAEAAQKLGARVGLDAKSSFESLTAALARGSTEMLDNLGIVLKQEQAHEEYARTLGVTVDRLTEGQKAEAFREVAMRKVIEAARGIKVDTDGAAAAVKRFENELDRLRLKALGAEEPTLALADGVAILDAKLLRGLAEHRTYGAAVDDVRYALSEAGVEVEKYRDRNDLLVRDIGKVLAREGDRLVALAEQGKLTNDLVDDIERLRSVKGALSEADERILYQGLKDLDLQNERERVAARAVAAEVAQRNERLLEIEEQLAFGRAAQISQEQLNALVAEEADLRALVLEAEGKGVEAAEVRRKAQLDALAALGESTRPRGGGRGRGRDRAAERAREQQEQAERLRAAWEQHNALANAIRAQRAADAELLQQAAAVDLEIQLGQVIDFEERRAQAVLAGRLREIELQRAAGVDPMQLLQREADARAEALAAQEEAVRQRAERAIAEAEGEGDYQGAEEARAEQRLALMDIQEEREAQVHALALARLDERERREAEVHDRRVAIAEEGMQLALGAAEAIVQGSVIEGRALKGVIAATAKGEAMRHGLILGPSALVQAAFHAATGNIPQATALGIAAAKHFAFAASMAGIAGAAGAFGGGRGRGRQVEGFGAEAFGGGGDAANSAPRSGGGGSWDIGGSVPLSADTRRRVGSLAAMPSAAGAQVVNVTTNLSLLGQPDDHTMLVLEQAQVRAGRRVGKLAAGGRG